MPIKIKDKVPLIPDLTDPPHILHFFHLNGHTPTVDCWETALHLHAADVDLIMWQSIIFLFVGVDVVTWNLAEVQMSWRF